MKKSICALVMFLLCATARAENVAVNQTLAAQTAQVGNQSFVVHSNGTMQLVPAGGPQLIGSPLLFPPGMPITGVAIPFNAAAMEVAKVRFSRYFRGEPLTIPGKSGKTTLFVFWYPDFQRLSKSSVLVSNISPPQFGLEPYHRTLPLGTVTVMANHDAGDSVDYGTLVGDLNEYLFDNVRGVQDIDIIGSPKAVAAPVGIKTRGGGFSIGGIIGTMASAKTAGLINPTIGGAETGAGPAVWPGIAVLVTAPNLGGTITVDPAELATRFVALAQALRGQ